MANPILYPAIGGAPGTTISREPAQAPEIRDRQSSEGIVSKQIPEESFNKVLTGEISKAVQEPIRFSAHASARLQSRNLKLGPDQMRKLNEAVDKAASKGLDDTLILTPEAAFIVSVKNRTVVTAMDKSSLDGNVFTNIDGAVIV